MQHISSDQIISDISLEEVLAQNKYTLLYFYPKNGTPGCTLEAQDFSKLASEFQKYNVQIVWVSKDLPESHCKFIEKYQLSPSSISDPDLELHKKFASWWEKNNYGKIVMGVIRSTFLLDSDENEINAWRSIRATWHADRVLKRVKENL